MKATEFCYWLQGAFELGGLPALTLTAMECIKKHLALVEKTNQDGQPEGAVKFCTWLAGGLDFIKHEDLTQTETVRIRLDAVFQHSIDLTYPEHPHLASTHGGMMRC